MPHHYPYPSKASCDEGAISRHKSAGLGGFDDTNSQARYLSFPEEISIRRTLLRASPGESPVI